VLLRLEVRAKLSSRPAAVIEVLLDLVADASVEGLDESILCRLAWCNEKQLHVVLVGSPL
jgi:hypothetical protein